jgi:hypothetical protein
MSVRVYAMPDDELDKLRCSLLHAYDKKKPLAQRLIEAMRGSSRARGKVLTPGLGKKKKSEKDAA